MNWKGLILAVVAFAGRDAQCGATPEPPPVAAPLFSATQDAAFAEADLLEKNNRFHEAIPVYETLLERGSGRDLRWTAYVLYRMGCAQYQAGDRIGGLESVQTAASLDPAEPSYQVTATEWSGQKGGTVYRARRDRGSAKRLVGRNGILHIFVRGRNADLPAMEQTRWMTTVLETSDHWLSAQAARNPRPVSFGFVHRVLVLPDEPFWRRIDVPTEDSPASYRRAWLEAIPARFGADSYADLFDRTFEGMDVDNRSIVFHAAIPYAMSARTIPCRAEAIDIEAILVRFSHSIWDRDYQSVSYMHALLHLFGADDLFNKVKEASIADTEVMSFGAHDLSSCTLSDLTRYAVGWIDKMPPLKQLRVILPATAIKHSKGVSL